MTQIERRMEKLALELSQRTTHAVSVERRRAAVADGKLGAEQQLAFGHVTRSRDLAVLAGFAGTGKSAMLDPAREAWEAAGYTVRGAALSGIAAEGLEAGSGIPSRTIASWERAWANGRQQLGPRDILVLDEAGMIGSRQMERVLSAVHEAGAKLVLVGDVEQLQAIEAGAAFRAIAERVGVVEITEVVRQRAGWQREATKELARGKTTEALARYEQAGMVRGHATDETARAALIAGWQTARLAAPQETQIILAHTRKDVRALNEAARDLRRSRGELGEDRVVPTELGLRRFATGDRLYFLQNDRGLGVKNGTLGTLVGIEGEGEAARLTVRLDAKDRKTGEQKRVAFSIAEYAHLDHGYAATIHKTQGVTADRTHVLATAGMDRHLAYVALSRHRQSVTLHWSKETFVSAEGLASMLSRERAKDTTLDYGESEAELFAAYAERRGLDPAPAFPASAHSPVARARLRRLQLAPEIRAVVSALRHDVETQKAVITGIAEALKSKQAPKSKPVIVETGLVRPPSTPTLQVDPSTVLDNLRRVMATPAAPWPALLGPSMAERLAAYEARQARKDARKQLAPMLPAIPDRPVTEHETAALAGAPVKLRDHLKSNLIKAYRNPEEAWARLDLLLQTSGSEEKVAAILKQKGPAALGQLRGKDGMFASEKQWNEHWEAEYAAKAIPDELTRPREMHQQKLDHCRIKLEARRSRDTIAIPGLTPEAWAAVELLQQAGARQKFRMFDTPTERMTPHQTAEAAKVGSVWVSVQADHGLAGEFAAFRKAAEARFGKTPDLKDLDVSKAYGVLQTLDHAEQLAARHQAVEKARKAQEQAEAARQEAAKLADKKRQQAARQAEMRSRPRSSGPGMG